MNPLPQSSLDKTVVDRIIELLRDAQGFTFFKKFYYGDPYDVPKSDMPCIAVDLLKTHIEYGPTGMDLITQTVQIILIYDRMDELTSHSSTEVTGVRTLEAFAQGVDPTSAEYESHTILGILRKHITMENTATDQSVDIEYGIVPRKGGATLECHITFTIEGLKLVSGRS
jgi:hypothetical protein